MNSHFPRNFKSHLSASPSLYMHEWFAVITILSFLLLLIVVTCKSRFEEGDVRVIEMLANHPTSKGLANVQVVAKKRRINSKPLRKTRARPSQKKNVKSNV